MVSRTSVLLNLISDFWKTKLKWSLWKKWLFGKIIEPTFNNERRREGFCRAKKKPNTCLFFLQKRPLLDILDDFLLLMTMMRRTKNMIRCLRGKTDHSVQKSPKNRWEKSPQRGKKRADFFLTLQRRSRPQIISTTSILVHSCTSRRQPRPQLRPRPRHPNLEAGGRAAGLAREWRFWEKLEINRAGILIRTDGRFRSRY